MTDRIANLLGALALALSDRIQAVAASPVGGPTAGAALVAVANHPGESVRALQRALGLTHSGTVRLLDTLEAAGLVERRRGTGSDGRAVAVWPTPAGRQGAEEALGRRADALASALGALTPDRLDALMPLLEDMLAAVTFSPEVARRICRFCDKGACQPQGCLAGRQAAAQVTPVAGGR